MADTWIFWVLLALAGLVVWKWRRPKRPAGHPRIAGPGQFAFEVVGESHYEESFVRILGASAAMRKEFFCDALLVLEDNNPHDSKAVAVFVNDLQVGHLPRETARQLRAQLAAQPATKGLTSVAVGARVWAGGANRRFSVSVDLPPG